MKIKRIGIFLFLLLFRVYEMAAQCTQCKQAAASRDADGNLVVGGGLNFGILYLLAMPFVFAAVIGGIWWWKNRQAKLRLQENL